MRPQANKKMGYYPCPEHAIDAIIPRLLAPVDPTGLAILDPCAGEARAIRQLGKGLGVPHDRTWLIELDAARGEACRAAMPTANLLSPCSFLQCEVRGGSFSLAYINPPFSDSLVQGVRAEEQFLSLALQLLCKGGILVFVCPESIVHREGFQHLLGLYCQNIDVVPFPRSVRHHDEVFVLAQRIEGFRMERANWRDLLAKGNGKYTITKAPGPGARFKKTGLTDEELAEYLDKSPLLDDFKAPPELTMARPPLALGKGHLALLLASGQLDGLVVAPDGAAHVVRGIARKVEEVTDEEVDKSRDKTVTKTTLTERIKTVIRAVWPDGSIRTLE